jgi:hypothetical protein
MPAMNSAARMAPLLLLALLVLGCGRREPAPFIMATAFSHIEPGPDQGQARLAASVRAENSARDQILAQALELQFPNGVTLADAAVQDPFIRAKLYDTVRGARITDQTFTDGETVSVTVRLDLSAVHRILENYPAPEPRG